MIQFKVINGQRLVQIGRTWIGADTSDQKAEFLVTDQFTGTLRVTFNIVGKDAKYQVTLDSRRQCTIPADVLSTVNSPNLPSTVDHVVNVSVSDSDTTTSIAKFPVFKTASGDNQEPVIPDEDAYNALLKSIPDGGFVSGNNMAFTNGNDRLFNIDVSTLVGGGSGSGGQGVPGGYYIPSVNASGVLSWQASQSGMPTVQSANIRGPQGSTGPQGPAGANGADGYTPRKGVDYYTPADKTEMVNSVLAALPAWTGGSY